MNNRILDVWAIYNEPQEILKPLKYILEHKEEIIKNGPLTLFTNCTSSFLVNGKKIGRYMDTVIYSYESDIALCLSSSRNLDEDLGASPEDIARFFDKHGIPYKIVFGEAQKDDIDDQNIPEIWMVREKYVLEDSLNDSKNRGCTDCIVYPNIDSKLSMGYYLKDGTYMEIWGLNFKGLIETDDSWSLLINENDPRNISIEDAIEIIKQNGLSYTIEDNPLKGKTKS